MRTKVSHGMRHPSNIERIGVMMPACDPRNVYLSEHWVNGLLTDIRREPNAEG
jgi:hypothetical protein